MNQSIDLKSFVSDIYDGEYADLALQGLEKLISDHRDRLSKAAGRFAGSGSSDHGGSSDGGSSDGGSSDGGSRLPLDQSDAFVITYGDSFLLGSPPADPSDKQKAELGIGGGIEDDGTILPLAAQDRRHLRALKAFADKYLKDVVSGIHILPFFPYSSDDGFSIVDYYEVNPAIGDWSDIADIGSSFRLMADLVLNHCSAKGPWFKAFLAGEKEFEHYFIDLPGGYRREPGGPSPNPSPAYPLRSRGSGHKRENHQAHLDHLQRGPGGFELRPSGHADPDD
jgi:hypothetical protein